MPRPFESTRPSAATSHDGSRAYRLRVFQDVGDELTSISEELMTSHATRAQVISAENIEVTREERRWLIEALLAAERHDGRVSSEEAPPAPATTVSDFASAFRRRRGGE